MNSHFFLLFSNCIQWCNDVINNLMITDDCVLIDEQTKRALKAWHKLPVWIRNTEYKNELNKAKCEQNSQCKPRPMSPTNRETLSSPKVRITALWNFPSELFGPDKKKKVRDVFHIMQHLQHILSYCGTVSLDWLSVLRLWVRITRN